MNEEPDVNVLQHRNALTRLRLTNSFLQECLKEAEEYEVREFKFKEGEEGKEDEEGEEGEEMAEN